MRIAYIFPIICSEFVNFLFVTKLSYYMKKKKSLKFVIFSILHLLNRDKGNNLYEKGIKTYYFRLKCWMCKRSIHHYFWKLLDDQHEQYFIMLTCSFIRNLHVMEDSEKITIVSQTLHYYFFLILIQKCTLSS